MYAFFRVDGQDDSLAFAKRLVAEVGLGLAPGVAFGPEAEGWLRWCFASRDPQRLTRGGGAAGRRARAIIRGFCGRPSPSGHDRHGAGRFHRRPQVKPETVAARPIP